MSCIARMLSPLARWTLIAAALVACQAPQTVPQTAAPTALSVATTFITPSVSPTHTATPLPTSTRTPIASPTPRPTPTPTFTPTPVPLPVRAVRLDFDNFKNSRAQVDVLEQKMQNANVNLVALGAGRLDWSYFKWEGHDANWSSDVGDTGIDFLAQDAARFSQWAKVDAVVDVFAPRYIATHPQSAAVSWLGKRSTSLVSTTELVSGEFGNQLIEMLDYIAAHYPVDSISITELSYYTEGYGDDDKATYKAYTGRADWPRNPTGLVNIDDPSIGKWRSYEIGRFLERAAATLHRYGKKLYMDVEVSWGKLELEATDKGQNYGVLLQYADRLVVWDYFGLSSYKPDYTTAIAHYLNKYGQNRIIISVGLWAAGGGVLSPDALRQAMQAGVKSEIPNLWITPSLYLSDQHWKVLADVWGLPVR